MKATIQCTGIEPQMRMFWVLPKWSGLGYMQVPPVYPKMKIPFSGIVTCETKNAYCRGGLVLGKVALDLMRRLGREIHCNMIPIDEGFGSDAWIEIQDSIPVGCATTCIENGERFLLGAWVKHEYRKTGVMSRLWQEIVKAHGNLRIVRPSEAMRAWASKRADINPTVQFVF